MAAYLSSQSLLSGYLPIFSIITQWLPAYLFNHYSVPSIYLKHYISVSSFLFDHYLVVFPYLLNHYSNVFPPIPQDAVHNMHPPTHRSTLFFLWSPKTLRTTCTHLHTGVLCFSSDLPRHSAQHAPTYTQEYSVFPLISQDTPHNMHPPTHRSTLFFLWSPKTLRTTCTHLHTGVLCFSSDLPRHSAQHAPTYTQEYSVFPLISQDTPHNMHPPTHRSTHSLAAAMATSAGWNLSVSWYISSLSCSLGRSSNSISNVKGSSATGCIQMVTEDG